jgi:ligand-binding sensor domain-containing protein
VTRACALTIAWSLATPAAAQGGDRYTVERVVGATDDAWDVAVDGDTVWVATSGGLVVLRAGVQRVITPYGARQRSVSLDEGIVYAGGVDGLGRVGAHGRNVLTGIDVRRATRVVRFGGKLWIGTAADGLFVVEEAEDAVAQPVRLGASHARARISDLLVHDGSLYVATQGAGVFRVDEHGAVRGRITTSRGLPDDVVWDLEPDGRRVLVGTMSGLGVIARDRAEPHHAEALGYTGGRDVRRVVRTADGGLAIGTWGAGAWVIDRHDRLAQVGGAREVRSLAVAADGAIYVAHPGGVTRVDTAGAVTSLLSASLPSPDVTTLARAGDRIWIGTYGEGLASMDASGAITRVDHGRWRVDPRVNDLAFADGALWIATDRGLFTHDGRSFTPVVDVHAPGSAEHVTAVHVADDGALWVASSRTLARRDAPTDRWTSWTGDARWPVAQLHAVTTDVDGRVWAGSLHGLFALDASTGRFDRHSSSSGALGVDWVTSIVRWDGALVAGTYHGGLSIRSTPSSAFTPIREGERGLSSGGVSPHAIPPIGDRLFVGTLDRGLLVGRLDARGALRFATLRIADGLPGNDVTDILPDGNRAAWIATRAGLARLVW